MVSPSGFSERGPCRCDKLCVVYDDCCVDYFDHCVNDTHFPIASNYTDFFECVNPLRKVKTKSYVVVARCPPSWPQDSIRQYCENDTLAESQTLLTVPVDDGPVVTFKNVYCSVCHQVPADRIESWIVTFRDCDLYDEAGEVTLDDDSCGKRILEKPIGSNVHQCYQDVVDTCPPTATPSQVALCENHTAVIHTYEGNPFQNVYCADCNNYTDWVCKFMSGSPLLSSAYSFSLLFDFTVNVVTVTEVVWATPVGSAQDLGTCGTWEIYDPFQKQFA